MITFSMDPAAIVQMLVAVVLPVLVGLVTTKVTHGGVKACLLALLTMVTSVLTELGRALAAHQDFDAGVALTTALPAFVISVATHFGVWKPTGVTDKVQAVLAKPHH